MLFYFLSEAKRALVPASLAVLCDFFSAQLAVCSFYGLELMVHTCLQGDFLECSEGNLTAKIVTPCNPTVVGRSRRRKKNSKFIMLHL